MLNISTIKGTVKEEKGFTLIELSIVLVIIGLIVGGILTGQDLIKAAEQRATLAQIEKYNTAVNTFRNKYNGIPGDLSEGTAVTFSLTAFTGAGAPCATVGGTGCGDGNGLIEGAASGSTSLEGETVLFWRHLSDASLIDGSYAQTDGGSATAGYIASDLKGELSAAAGPTTINLLLPLAKLGRSNYISVGTYGGINYYAISGMGKSTLAVTTAGVESNGTNNLSPLESYSMDKKVDDGLPLTGSVVALDAATTQPMIAAGGIGTLTNTTACLTVAATNAYVVNTGATPGCSLRFRFN